MDGNNVRARSNENTTYQNRCIWVEIFRHEYVMLIWLPQHGFQQSEAASKNVAYISERVFSDPSYCYCGLQKASPEDANKGFFCGHPIMKVVEQSVKDGKIAPQLLKLMLNLYTVSKTVLN